MTDTEHFELEPSPQGDTGSTRIRRKAIIQKTQRALDWAIFALQDAQPHQLNALKALHLCREASSDLERVL